ncbi:MAG: gliding motility-associated C-terminal domain-containing protein [Chitinophagales bacterium]
MILLSGLAAQAQTNISGVINYYYEVTGFDKCNNSVSLSATPVGLVAGDNVLLIQMRGIDASALNDPTYGSIIAFAKSGTYEMLTVQSVVFNVVTFNETMLRPYDVTGHVQLVRIPEYNDVNVVGTVTGQPWDGSTGGIIGMKVNGTLTLNADIDASGIGFRGADVVPNTPCVSGNPLGFDGYVTIAGEDKSGKKGEGVSNNGDNRYSRGAIVNGGGGGNDRQTGGGGGSNNVTGGGGGQLLNPVAGLCGGTYPGIGGWAIPYDNVQNRIFMGGGGGAGSSNLGAGTPGGNGGGIIFINTNNLNGNGNAIRSNGISVTTLAADDGAGGGGGAGTIALEIAGGVGSPVNVELMGGDGGSVDNSVDGINCVGPGGGGSGGLLWMPDPAVPGGVNVFAMGGSSGITIGEAVGSPCYNSTNNATDGSDGGFLGGLSIPRSATTYVELTVDMIPDDAVVCQGNELFMSVVATGTGMLHYLWNDPDTTQTPDCTVTPPYDITYTVIVSDQLGCQLIGFVVVDVIDSVVVTANPDTTLELGNIMTLETNLDDTYTYLWSPAYNISDVTDPNPEIYPYQTTTYCVTATHPTGCTSTDCVTILVGAAPAFPNAFTPNGDGVNDVFRVPPSVNLCDDVSLFKVYDRWGQVVYDYFDTADSEGWDGTDGDGHQQEIGTYIYLIRMECDGEMRTFSGPVHLLR